MAIGHSKSANQLSSNSWDRILPRLARDAPEVMERVKTGEIKSARAAAIEAGIIIPFPSLQLKEWCLQPMEELLAINCNFRSYFWRHLTVDARPSAKSVAAATAPYNWHTPLQWAAIGQSLASCTSQKGQSLALKAAFLATKLKANPCKSWINWHSLSAYLSMQQER